MALILADRVRETTTTVGTGSVTLAGALTGYQTFSAAVGDGNTTYYVIAGQGTSEWEVGVGTYASAGNTLARTTVLASSNAGSLVTFSAGTKDVWVDYAAGKAVTTDTLAYPPAIGGTTPAAGTFTTLTATGQTSLGGAAGSEGFRTYVPTTTGAWLSTLTTGSAVFLGNQGTSLPFLVNTNQNSFSIRTGALGAVGEEQVRVTRTASAVNYVQVTGSSTNNWTAISAQGSDSNVSLASISKGTGALIFSTNGASGNRQFQVSGAVTSPVNYLQVQGSTTGNQPFFTSQGTDTNIALGISSKGTGSVGLYTNGGGSAQFIAAHTASAVNYVQVTGNSTTNAPVISTQGSDTNVGLVLSTKGTGRFDFFTNNVSQLQFRVDHTASAVNYVQVSGGATATDAQISAQGSDTNIWLQLNGKGSRGVAIGYFTRIGRNFANYFEATGNNAGSSPILSVGGSDTNIGLQLISKGTGAINLMTNGGVNQVVVLNTASAVNYIQATGSATGSGVTLSAQGSDTNIDINLVPKGTGTTVYTGGVTINGTLTAQNEVLKGTGQNLLVQSSSLTTTWTQQNSSLTGGQADPFGGTTAATMNSGTSVSTQHSFFQATAYASNTYTLSIYAKAGTANYIGVYLSNPNSGVIFNLATGSFSTNIGTAPTSYAITAVSGAAGWYRCSVVVSGVQNFSQFFISEDGTNLTFTGTSKTITVAAPQLEIGNTLNTYIPTTTTAVYGTPTLSFSGVAGIGLQSDGSLYVQPAGTGALQAQATTSTATGGNARGANAVDWQTSRNVASQVASSSYSVVAGGNANTSSSFFSAVSGGTQNTSNGSYSGIVGGVGNTISGSSVNSFGFVGGGYANTSSGVFNFIGGGYTNSGTSASAVTTQSATMNATTAVTLAASNASIKVGQLISGTSISSFPPTYVAAVSGTSLTLSQAASGSSTSTLSFYTPHGVVVGGGNNQATGSYSFIGGGGDAGTAGNRNVASGDWSFVGGGRANTASGVSSVVVGGGYDGGGGISPNNSVGQVSFIGGGLSNYNSAYAGVVTGGFSNSALNTASTVSGGGANTANANYSAIMGGFRGTTRSIIGNHAFPACSDPITTTQGVSQAAMLVLGNETLNASPVVLRSTSAAASTTNQVILPNNAAYYFKGSVIANVTGAANGAAWSIEGAIMRGANAASTVLIDTPSVNRVAASAGATAWVVSVTADTTNGGLAVTVTGAASTTIRWVAKLETTETAF